MGHQYLHYAENINLFPVVVQQLAASAITSFLHFVLMRFYLLLA
jgi:hypothetical protein